MEYGISTQRAAQIFGVELMEIPDWNCCGATSAHSTNKLLSLALPARNLALAEQEGLDVLAPCAACFSRFRAAEYHVRKDAALREQVQEAIGMEYRGDNHTWSILELLAIKVGLETIRGKVVRPLKGMKPACYYGCLLVRPSEYTGFDDPEYPQTMDNIMKTLGARPINWAHQTECCGASLVTTRPEVGLRMTYEIIKNAKERGADSIVTACPLCQMNLDMRQAQVEKRFGVKLNLPIYYITQLVAVACGDSPETVGVHRHFVEAVYHINHLPEEIEEEVNQAATRKKAALETAQAKKAARAETVSEASAEDQPPAAPRAEDIGINKGALKLATRLFEADEVKASQLAEILCRDPEKLKKVAQILAQDKDKAVKVAEAFIKKEAKARGEEVSGE